MALPDGSFRSFLTSVAGRRLCVSEESRYSAGDVERHDMTKRPFNPGDFSEEEERFARRLWAARKLAKMSHAKLAESTGLARYFISNIENLKSNPSLLTCARLARGVGRDLGDLLTERPVEDLDRMEGWSPS